MKLSDYVIRWGRTGRIMLFFFLTGKRSLMEKRMLYKRKRGIFA